MKLNFGSDLIVHLLSMLNSSWFWAECIVRLFNNFGIGYHATVSQLMKIQSRVDSSKMLNLLQAQTVASFEKTLASLNHKLSEMLLEGSESTANEIENLKNLIERLKMLQKTDLLSNSQKELRDPTAVSKSRDNHVRANSLDAASFLSSEPPIIEERGRESSGMNNSASVSASLEEGGSDKTVASDDLTVGSANESAASSTSPQLSSEKMHDKKVKKNWVGGTLSLITSLRNMLFICSFYVEKFEPLSKNIYVLSLEVHFELLRLMR